MFNNRIIEIRGGKLVLHILAAPKSAKSSVDKIVEESDGKQYLKVKINAPPEDGKANKELVKFLAKEWGLAPSKLEIISGELSRRKIIEADIDPEFIKKWMKLYEPMF